MFYGTVEDTKACNLAALKGLSCGKEIFQEIFREKFANFWTKEIEKIVEQNGVLKTAADKIGNQMVTECMMNLQGAKLMPYLTRTAKSFTQNRIIITTQSYYHMIFGKKVNMSRKKFFEPFVDKADRVIETEYALQCRKLLRENEKEITGGNET